jgi:hypothetical protein
LTLWQVFPDYNAPSTDQAAWRLRVANLYDSHGVQYDRSAFLQSGFSSSTLPLRTQPGLTQSICLPDPLYRTNSNAHDDVWYTFFERDELALDGGYLWIMVDIRSIFEYQLGRVISAQSVFFSFFSSLISLSTHH